MDEQQTENDVKMPIVRAAMTFGLFMGIYWAVKYLFFMFSYKIPLLNSIYIGMTVIVPFIAYRMTDGFRVSVGGKLRFSQGWMFGVLLYFFAGLIVSLMHYIYYAYVAPPGLLADSFNQVIAMFEQANVDPETLEPLKNQTLKPINMTIQGLLNNVFYGVILSLPVAWLISRK